MKEIVWLSASEVREALPMGHAVPVMEAAYMEYSTGGALTPQRLQFPLRPHDGTTLVMPSYSGANEMTGVKVVSVYPDNVEHDLPAILGVMMLLDSRTGEPLMMAEGSTLTGIRTGAGSGAATDLLAQDDSESAAILGTGGQAPYQLLGLMQVRPIQKVHLYNRTPERVDDFLDRMDDYLADTRFDVEYITHRSANEAVAAADVVCTATSASEPLFDADAAQPGTHINAIGAFRPEMQEIPPELVGRARVYVDGVEAAREEAGDLLQAAEAGVTDSGEWSEIGAVANGDAPGRRDADEITLFKSVGLAIQDTVAAAALYRYARGERTGTPVSLD